MVGKRKRFRCTLARKFALVVSSQTPLSFLTEKNTDRNTLCSAISSPLGTEWPLSSAGSPDIPEQRRLFLSRKSHPLSCSVVGSGVCVVELRGRAGWVWSEKIWPIRGMSSEASTSRYSLQKSWVSIFINTHFTALFILRVILVIKYSMILVECNPENPCPA